MKWATCLAVGETEREKKGAKKAKKNMVRVAKKRDRLKTDLKLCIPERESLGNVINIGLVTNIQIRFQTKTLVSIQRHSEHYTPCTQLRTLYKHFLNKSQVKCTMGLTIEVHICI